MAVRVKDVFGFDELQKSLKRLEKKIPDKTDRILTAYARAAQKRAKELAPVYGGTYRGSKSKQKPGDLKRKIRSLRLKEYKGGQIKVARIETKDPKGHLIEDGHEIYRVQNKTGKKIKDLGLITRAAAGVTHHGRTREFKMIETAVKEADSAYRSDVRKALEQAIDEEGLDV